MAEVAASELLHLARAATSHQAWNEFGEPGTLDAGDVAPEPPGRFLPTRGRLFGRGRAQAKRQALWSLPFGPDDLDSVGCPLPKNSYGLLLLDAGRPAWILETATRPPVHARVRIRGELATGETVHVSVPQTGAIFVAGVGELPPALYPLLAQHLRLLLDEG